MRKGKGREARLSFMGHALTENNNGLLMDFLVSRATGRAEREAMPVMLDDVIHRGSQDPGRGQGLRHPGVCQGHVQSGGDAPRGSADPLGYRRTHHEARQLQGESEGAQEGGGNVRVDEDGGRVAQDSVPGSGEDEAGWVPRGYGLQPGEDDQPGIV